MNQQLRTDAKNIDNLLQTAVSTTAQFFNTLNERPATTALLQAEMLNLPERGHGAAQALATFQQRYGEAISGSVGSRYLGFVTGGSTPAALLGDWLASAYDQNAADETAVSLHVEQEAISMLRQLFGLPSQFAGTFVSGATVSNMVGLAQGRQWVAQQMVHNVAEDGLHGLPQIPVLAATPHSSVYKALAMLGMGRSSLQKMPTLPNREALDVAALEERLNGLNGRSAIIVGSAGTVNSVDFDDLAALAALRDKYNAWLHVDAAFGGFAAVSPRYDHLTSGINLADSITIDAHKWLNVPYDSAMTFTRHPKLQVEVFRNSAVYLGPVGATPGLVHWTPQNSRRFRALPAWFTLQAYGRAGYLDIVERQCGLAQALAAELEASDKFTVIAPVHLNVVCFTLTQPELTQPQIQQFLNRLRDDGRVFMTPTSYFGKPAIRAAFSNWQTTAADLPIIVAALHDI